MIETTVLFDDGTMRMLRSYLGWSIESLQGYLLAEDPDQAYKRLRIDFGGMTIDLSNEHQELCIGPGRTCEDVAVLQALENVSSPLWHPRGRDLTTRPLDFTVDDIYLVIDTALLTKGSIRKNKVKLVQAVVFRSGVQLLAVDRDIWFDENLVVRFAEIPHEEGFVYEDDIWDTVRSMVRDCEGDWVAEPPLGYSFQRDIMSVSAGEVRS